MSQNRDRGKNTIVWWRTLRVRWPKGAEMVPPRRSFHPRLPGRAEIGASWLREWGEILPETVAKNRLPIVVVVLVHRAPGGGIICLPDQSPDRSLICPIATRYFTADRRWAQFGFQNQPLIFWLKAVTTGTGIEHSTVDRVGNMESGIWNFDH